MCANSTRGTRAGTGCGSDATCFHVGICDKRSSAFRAGQWSWKSSLSAIYRDRTEAVSWRRGFVFDKFYIIFPSSETYYMVYCPLAAPKSFLNEICHLSVEL